MSMSTVLSGEWAGFQDSNIIKCNISLPGLEQIKVVRCKETVIVE